MEPNTGGSKCKMTEKMKKYTEKEVSYSMIIMIVEDERLFNLIRYTRIAYRELCLLTCHSIVYRKCMYVYCTEMA